MSFRERLQATWVEDRESRTAGLEIGPSMPAREISWFRARGRNMRATEFLAVQGGESPTDPRITHLERLPKAKWKEQYVDLPKDWEGTNTGAGYDEEP